MFSVYGSFQIKRKPLLFPVGRRALTPPHLITKQTNQLSRTIIECAKRRGHGHPPYDVRMKMQLNPGRILHLFSVGTALRSEPYSAAKPRFNLMRLRAQESNVRTAMPSLRYWDEDTAPLPPSPREVARSAGGRLPQSADADSSLEEGAFCGGGKPPARCQDEDTVKSGANSSSFLCRDRIAVRT